MEYLLLSLGFIATLIAVKGNTWDSNKNGLKRITRTGYLTLTVALLALIFASYKHHNENGKSKKKEVEFQKLVSESTKINDTVQILNKRIAVSNQLLLTTKDSVNAIKTQLDSSIHISILLKNKVDTYKGILDRISSESERQPQWDFVNYIRVRPQNRDLMPSRLYSGSLLKFVGLFCNSLFLEYGERRIKIPESPYNRPVEIPIIGPSGQQFRWYLRNEGDEECDCKIYKMSTPRTRSSKRSWEEEKL